MTRSAPPAGEGRQPQASDTVTVAACQLAPSMGEPARNLESVLRAADHAVEGGARLLVFPELATSGYAFVDREEAGRLAEHRDGATLTRLAEAARDRGLVLVAGFPELGDDGGLYNSAVLIDPTGVRAVYRKVHLWDRETEIFTPGEEPPPVVDTPAGRVGVVICYDLEFPEWVRLAALDGAEIVCAPTNWPAEPRPGGERPIEVVRAQASASVNHIFIAVADRTRAERGIDWVSGSVVVAPDGFPLATASPEAGEQTLLADCRLADARDKRVSPRNDVLADRRPDLYRRVSRSGQR